MPVDPATLDVDGRADDRAVAGRRAGAPRRRRGVCRGACRPRSPPLFDDATTLTFFTEADVDRTPSPPCSSCPAAPAERVDTVRRVALTIRPLTADDDLAEFGRIVQASYLRLDGHPADPDYDDQLLDVADRVRRAMVIGAFDGRRAARLRHLRARRHHPVRRAPRRRRGELPHARRRRHGAGPRRRRGPRRPRASTTARRDGRSGVFIHSGDWMHAAHRLYGRLGFRHVPERDWDGREARHRPARVRARPKPSGPPG